MPWPDFEITPLARVGPFVFGMSKPEVHNLGSSFGYGPPVAFRRGDEDTEHLDDGRVQFIYTDDGQLAAVQFAAEVEAAVRYRGHDLVKEPATVVTLLLASAGEHLELERGCTFVSLALGISLWRTARVQRHFKSVLVSDKDYIEGYRDLF